MAAPSTLLSQMGPGAPPDPRGHGPLSPGQRVERFEVEAHIGSGGVAEVYRVRHLTLGSHYALKVLRVSGPQLRARLLSEGRAQARLNHPNLVRVHDVLEVEGSPALLMDLVEGPPLHRWVETYPPTLSQIEEVFRGIISGVAAAHTAGVIHRDLKPANVLMSPSGEGWIPRVSDFGIARHLGGEGGGADLTRAGVVLGTPAYMAPEQLRDVGGVDERADVFALGVMLYELCFGERPFRADDVLQLITDIDQGRYLRPAERSPQLPAALSRAIEGCLIPSPRQRIPNTRVLKEVLDGGEWQPPVVDTPTQGTTQERLVTLPSARSAALPRWVGQLGGALGAALALAAGALLHTRGELTTQRQLTYAQAMAARAWEISERQPAESLALLRAADQLLAAEGHTPHLDREALELLTSRGAASRVFPLDADGVVAAISPGGEAIAVGMLGGEVAVWESRTGAQRFSVHAGARRFIDVLEFSADSSQIRVTPGYGVQGENQPRPARSLDALTGEVVHTYAHGDRTTRLVVAPNGKKAATLGQDSRLLVWDLTTGAPALTIQLPFSSPTQSLAISPDSKTLAVFLGTQPLQIYDLDTGQLLQEMAAPSMSGVGRVGFSRDGAAVILSYGQRIATWDLRGRLLATPLLANGPTLALGRPDLVVHSDGSLGAEVRELPSLSPLWRLTGLSSSAHLATLVDGGQWVVLGSLDARMGVWSTRGGAPLARLHGHTSRIMSVAAWAGQAGTLALSASRDRTARLWTLPVAAQFRPLREAGDLPSQHLWADHAGEKILRVKANGAVQLVDVTASAARELRGPTTTPEAGGSQISAARLSDDGTLAAVRDGVSVNVFDTRDGRVLRSYPPTIWLRYLSFSADTRTMIGWSDTPQLLIYDLATDALPRHVPLPTVPFRVLYSEDGSRLVMACRDGDLMVVDKATGASISRHTLTRDGSGLSALLLDGDRAVVADWKGTIKVWDQKTQQVERELKHHGDAVLGLVRDPTGALLASSGWDRSVALWSWPGGALLHHFDGLSAEPGAPAFSQDGALVAAGGRDGLIRVWDTHTGALVAVRRCASSVVFLGFDAAQGVLTAIDADEQLYRWPAIPAADEAPGALTNLRVCQGTLSTRAVLPYPPPETVWAPPDLCMDATPLTGSRSP